MSLSEIQMNLLKQISDIEKTPTGAYNIRANGKLHGRNNSSNIEIVTKTDNPGIDVIIKPNTKNERVDLPVLITETGIKDIVLKLSSKEFMRLKIGIGKSNFMETKDYVLGKFSNDDQIIIKQLKYKMVEIFNDYTKISFDNLMNKYN
jgi:hypothetical protein